MMVDEEMPRRWKIVPYVEVLADTDIVLINSYPEGGTLFTFLLV